MHSISSIFLGILLILLAEQVWSDGSLRNLENGSDAFDEFTGKGQWVIVKFWASDCHVCNQEAHQYVDFHEFHKDNDVVILGVSLDGSNKNAAKEFIRRHQVSYPNLITGLFNGTKLYSIYVRAKLDRNTQLPGFRSLRCFTCSTGWGRTCRADRTLY